MSEALIFAAGSVLFVLTTAATFLFLMLRFNEVYEDADAELETLESAALPATPTPPSLTEDAAARPGVSPT